MPALTYNQVAIPDFSAALRSGGRNSEYVSGGLGTIGQGLTSLGDRINNRQKKKYDDEVKGHESAFESILAQAIDEEDLLRLADEHRHNEEDQHHYSNEPNLIQEYRNHFINQGEVKSKTRHNDAQARGANATAYKTELDTAELERQAKLADEAELFGNTYSKEIIAIKDAYFEQNEELGDRLKAELLKRVDHSLFSPETISTIFGGVEKSTISGYRVVEGIEKGNRQRSDTVIKENEKRKSNYEAEDLRDLKNFEKENSSLLTEFYAHIKAGRNAEAQSVLKEIQKTKSYNNLSLSQKEALINQENRVGKTGLSITDTQGQFDLTILGNKQEELDRRNKLEDTRINTIAENYITKASETAKNPDDFKVFGLTIEDEEVRQAFFRKLGEGNRIEDIINTTHPITKQQSKTATDIVYELTDRKNYKDIARFAINNYEAEIRDDPSAQILLASNKLLQNEQAQRFITGGEDIVTVMSDIFGHEDKTIDPDKKELWENQFRGETEKLLNKGLTKAEVFAIALQTYGAPETLATYVPFLKRHKLWYFHNNDNFIASFHELREQGNEYADLKSNNKDDSYNALEQQVLNIQRQEAGVLQSSRRIDELTKELSRETDLKEGSKYIEVLKKLKDIENSKEEFFVDDENLIPIQQAKFQQVKFKEIKFLEELKRNNPRIYGIMEEIVQNYQQIESARAFTEKAIEDKKEAERLKKEEFDKSLSTSF